MPTRITQTGLRVLMVMPDHPVGPSWLAAARRVADVTPLSLPRARIRPSRLFWRANDVLDATVVVSALRGQGEQDAPYDLIHSHFAAGSRGVARAARAADVPYIISEHSSWFTGANPEKPAIDDATLARVRECYRGASAVLPVSRPLADAMTELGLGDDWTVVSNPVDTDLFHPLCDAQPEAASSTIVTVGRLSSVKRHGLLIDAFALVHAQRPDARLCIIGAGPDESALRDLAASAGLTTAVEFTGPLSPAAVAARLRESAVFATASATENNPVAVIEAAATGLPIVAGALPAIAEIAAEDALTVADPNDAEAFAAALVTHLPASGPLAAQREQAVARFSYDAIATQLESAYRAAVSVPVAA